VFYDEKDDMDDDDDGAITTKEHKDVIIATRYYVWRKLPFQQRRAPFRRNAQALTGWPNVLVQ
jgi:hypothetical protein